MIKQKKVKVKSLSSVQLFLTPWTVAYQAPQSMGISRQEYWSGLPFPSPGELPDPGIKLVSPALEADTLPSEPPGKLNRVINSVTNRMERSFIIQTKLMCLFRRYLLSASCMVRIVLGHGETAMKKTSKAL